MIEDAIKARDALWARYNAGCAAVGYPCDYIPDEAMYHALKKLDASLGIDTLEIDLKVR